MNVLSLHVAGGPPWFVRPTSRVDCRRETKDNTRHFGRIGLHWILSQAACRLGRTTVKRFGSLLDSFTWLSIDSVDCVRGRILSCLVCGLS